MASTYTNQLLVIVGGKIQKIAADDNLVIGGAFTALSLSGDGAGITGIPTSGVTGLDSALSTLTSDVSNAQSDATQAISDAAIADGKAVAAQADADAAQSTADAAAAAASVADGKAVAAQADADAAQSTADAAAAAASVADGKAVAAQADADAAQSTADAAAAAASVADGKAVAAQADADSAQTAADAAQADATLAIGNAALAQATADAALPLAGGTLTGPLVGTSASFSGDVVVQGNLITKGSVDVLISDSFLDLNSGNTVSASATAGGLTVNVKASGSAETATTFVAGVLATSAPSFTTSVASSFAAGEIVQISGSVDGKNDGLFVVASVVGSTVTIKGIGGSAIDLAKTPFVQNQFVAQTAQTASVTKVDLAVLAASNGLISDSVGAIPAGTWCYKYAAAATESSFSVWTAITAASVPTLSQVLTAGSMIGADNEIGFTGAVASAAVKGDLLYVASDGEAKLISTAIAGGELDGVALEAGGSGKEIATVVGQKIWVGIAGAAPAIGDLLYVSATAGRAVVAAPTSGRLIKVGKCVGLVGSGANSGLYPVLFQPQYLADL